MGCVEINKANLPYKAAYFLFYAAFGSFWPYLGVYMMDMGLTAGETALIFGIMPLIAGVEQPVIGLIADKFRRHKTILIFCCICTGPIYLSILSVPPREQNIERNQTNDLITVHCNQNGSYGEVCPANALCKSTNINNNIPLCQATCRLDMFDISQTALCLNYQKDELSHCASLAIHFPDLLDHSVTDKSVSFYAPKSQVVCKEIEVDTSCITLNFASVLYNDVKYGPMNCSKNQEVQCNVTCYTVTGGMVNNSTSGSNSDKSSKYDDVFWRIFVISLFANMATYPILSLLDGVTYGFLGEERGKWGLFRLWGTVGYGMFALIGSLFITLLDTYMFAFIIYTALTLLCAISILFMQKTPETQQTDKSNIRKNLWQIFKRAEILFLFCIIFFSGCNIGLIITFLFWYLETLGAIQILFGLDVVVYVTSEVIVMAFAGRIIRAIGPVNCVYIGFGAYSIRLLCYSFLINPWTVLLIEPIHGLNYALMYSAATYQASQITPDGMHATVQGMCASLFFCFGVGLGSIISGQVVDAVGVVWTFRIFALSVVPILLLYIASHKLCFEKSREKMIADKLPPEEMQIQMRTSNGQPEAEIKSQSEAKTANIEVRMLKEMD